MGLIPNTILYRQSSTVTVSGGTGSLNVSQFNYVSMMVNVSAATGTTPSIVFSFVLNDDAVAGNGFKFDVGDTVPITVAPTLATMSVGPGCVANAVLPNFVSVNWTVSGTTPSFTFTLTLIGK
jgi:hypothetical protein